MLPHALSCARAAQQGLLWRTTRAGTVRVHAGNACRYIEFNEFVAFWANPQEKVAAAQAAGPQEAAQDGGATAGS